MAKCDFSRNVDNDLAFFSVKTDSSMDMTHLIRYTHDNITSGSEINIYTQVPYSMLDRSVHVASSPGQSQTGNGGLGFVMMATCPRTMCPVLASSIRLDVFLTATDFAGTKSLINDV